MSDLEFIKSLKSYRDKYNRDRLPENIFLYRLFSKLESKQSIENKDIIIYFIGNQVYANYFQKNKDFYYCYYKIYSVLKSEFGLNRQKITRLIQGMVDDYLKLEIIYIELMNNSRMKQFC